MRRLLYILALFSTVVASPGEAASIRVQAGDWGAASAQDIEAVLNSVAAVLLADFPDHANVRIVVSPGSSGPRVLAAKSADGAHQVLLRVRDARWDQFAYQFSHELCHIVSNYDHREVDAGRPHQWFEETLCEVVSVVTLERLAVRWQQSPPHRGWESYAPAFHDYAERLTSAAHRHAATSLAAWYRANAAELERDPYLREKNEAAASSLAKLFGSTPGALHAIAYLNLSSAGGGGFADYLAAWYECCPQAQRPLVLQLISLFSRA